MVTCRLLPVVITAAIMRIISTVLLMAKVYRTGSYNVIYCAACLALWALCYLKSWSVL